MMKKLLTYIFFLSIVWTAEAEKTRFTMSAPNAVQVGKQFRLSFTSNEQGTDLQLPPSLTSNFQILMGPSTGYSSSKSTINGKVTQEVNYSYTYVLRAKKEGKFELRPASIKINGEIFESNTIKIQVVKAQASQQQTQGNAKQAQGAAQSVQLNKDNLFVRVALSKRNVFRGEQIVATVKLYANPNLPIAGFDEVNLPTYEGFYTHDVEIAQQIDFKREVFNEKIYQVGTLKKTVLIPQQNGKLTIKPFSLSLLIRQRVKARSFFDDFFDNYRTVKTRITSNAISINVKDLPPTPANFMGGVGDFNITSEISKQEVTTNDAITLKIKVNGKGNIRLIRTPELKLPADFEVYDPKTTDNVKATGAGVSGTKTIEYLFQPRFEGNYTIPPVKFAYFNPASGKYITKATPEYNIRAKKGTEEQSSTVVSSLRKEDVQLIGKDIRFIKQGKAMLKKKGETFFGSLLFYLVHALSILLFIALFIIYRKRARESANIALVKNKKANRIANKRLKAASGFMKQNNNEAFHEEILKAFWGYLSDKLSIPVADLNRESAIKRLQKKNVEESTIKDFEEVVEQCEFARYAPSEGSEARHELYKKAQLTMSRFEKQIKK